MSHPVRPRNSGDPVLYRVGSSSVMPMYSVLFRRLANTCTEELIARGPGSPLSRGRTDSMAIP
jgi:hypothetical protein